MPRDLTWLKAIHRHGPLASSFLIEFAKPLGMNQKRAQERLADLFHEDNTVHGGAYLQRPAQQFHTLDARYNQIVSDLSPAGVKALKQADSWHEQSGPQGGPWWHKFMIASVTASMELACMARSDVEYIPQWKILERAHTTLEADVSYVDSASGKPVQKRLKPDALFGLEYRSHGRSRYRFFVVEADRATEPLTTKTFNRKSARRSFAQYRAYIERGLYKQHLNLTAPVLVLNVTTSEARRDALIKTLLSDMPGGNDYMMFQHWEAFASPPTVPKPNPALLSGSWLRAGREPLRIDA
jgi:protein involved in plasmid replication-relaxation